MFNKEEKTQLKNLIKEVEELKKGFKINSETSKEADEKVAKVAKEVASLKKKQNAIAAYILLVWEAITKLQKTKKKLEKPDFTTAKKELEEPTQDKPEEDTGDGDDNGVPGILSTSDMSIPKGFKAPADFKSKMSNEKDVVSMTGIDKILRFSLEETGFNNRVDDARIKEACKKGTKEFLKKLSDREKAFYYSHIKEKSYTTLAYLIQKHQNEIQKNFK